MDLVKGESILDYGKVATFFSTASKNCDYQARDDFSGKVMAG